WAAQVIGDELASLQGDNFVRDVASAIGRASHQQLAYLVEGYRTMRTGREKAIAQLHHEATALYGEAATDFSRGGDEASRLAAQRGQADSEYAALNLPRALELVTKVRDESDRLGYPQISGAAWWLIGSITGRGRLLPQAQQAYEAALRRMQA